MKTADQPCSPDPCVDGRFDQPNRGDTLSDQESRVEKKKEAELKLRGRDVDEYACLSFFPRHSL